jgi:hypothetical protein
MEENDKKTIKTIGIIVIALSAFIGFGNGMGALAYSIINSPGPTDSTTSNKDFMMQVWDNYLTICLSMFSLAILNIIGGIGLIKFKKWGRILLILGSILLILSIISISVILSIAGKDTFGIASILMSLLIMLVFVTPFILLIRFLSRERIKIYFS